MQCTCMCMYYTCTYTDWHSRVTCSHLYLKYAHTCTGLPVLVLMCSIRGLPEVVKGRNKDLCTCMCSCTCISDNVRLVTEIPHPPPTFFYWFTFLSRWSGMAYLVCTCPYQKGCGSIAYPCTCTCTVCTCRSSNWEDISYIYLHVYMYISPKYLLVVSTQLLTY